MKSASSQYMVLYILSHKHLTQLTLPFPEGSPVTNVQENTHCDFLSTRSPANLYNPPSRVFTYTKRKAFGVGIVPPLHVNVMSSTTGVSGWSKQKVTALVLDLAIWQDCCNTMTRDPLEEKRKVLAEKSAGLTLHSLGMEVVSLPLWLVGGAQRGTKEQPNLHMTYLALTDTKLLHRGAPVPTPSLQTSPGSDAQLRLFFVVKDSWLKDCGVRAF
ncbi:hypothetical protein WISP_81685 [Willisornis vidua]|uniref:Uncharacterized protein n=1 Tax=Willisornis vidua TaxID=1566151 RepID=A0ABQ9D4J7_9PASS|nr:hypothetical protein WISP_81685 [Willisornis vidua]